MMRTFLATVGLLAVIPSVAGTCAAIFLEALHGSPTTMWGGAVLLLIAALWPQKKGAA